MIDLIDVWSGRVATVVDTVYEGVGVLVKVDRIQAREHKGRLVRIDSGQEI